ncbi:hypothetical protein HMPREF9134_01726 [Porphyromonas catoniae F0037]|uniref:Uncharacterized protein n=1 Tax=Porphyromonas catoniae F0037 TaxID=1127696 RepID=L1NB26_9PORP|nr:hypothetical protein HMPREF9134_01726 [Porphyromonas catoniae F0037]
MRQQQERKETNRGHTPDHKQKKTPSEPLLSHSDGVFFHYLYPFPLGFVESVIG